MSRRPSHDADDREMVTSVDGTRVARMESILRTAIALPPKTRQQFPNLNDDDEFARARDVALEILENFGGKDTFMGMITWLQHRMFRGPLTVNAQASRWDAVRRLWSRPAPANTPLAYDVDRAAADAAAGAVLGLLLRVELAPYTYFVLTRPWRTVVGEIHPGDEGYVSPV